MRTEFQQALAAAQDRRDASGRIDLIKKAVVAEVRAADPAVTIRTTDYFNHSYAPDMVLSWPRENRERLLFVRPSASPEWLVDDLLTVSSHHPMLFTLEDMAAAEQTAADDDPTRTELDNAATRSDTWITDPSGIAAISTVRADNPVLGLLSQALVRGGRGLADDRLVEALTESTTGGFVGAAAQETESTREAVLSIQAHLDAIQSGRLTRVLRAVWEGNGGSVTNFPSPVDVGALTDDDLTYLLSATTGAPQEFWRRVGRTVTTEQLGRVRIDDPSTSLHALVSANLDSLQAKGLRVMTEPHQLGESEDVPRWMVSRGCLALRGLNWVAYLAGRRVEELPQPDEARSPSIDTLRRRSGDRRVSITRVQFGQGNTAVTYESRDGLDVMQDPLLATLAADVGDATIEAAAATLAGGGTVNLDFPRRSATGPTSSMFPVGQLVRSVLPLVADLADEEAAALSTALASPTAADTLFPDQVFE